MVVRTLCSRLFWSLNFLSLDRPTLTQLKKQKKKKQNKKQNKKNKTKARMQNIYFAKFEGVILIPLTVEI